MAANSELQSLKRKYSELLVNAAELMEEVSRLKRQKLQWKEEREFLKDKVADLAQISIAQKEEQAAKEGEQAKSKPRRRSRNRRHKQSDAACAMEQNGRPCKMKALVGCKYCWHHAAFDPNSDYQFCEHVDPSGKKCLVSVPKNATIKFCQNHKKKYDQEKSEEPSPSASQNGKDKKTSKTQPAAAPPSSGASSTAPNSLSSSGKSATPLSNSNNAQQSAPLYNQIMKRGTPNQVPLSSPPATPNPLNFIPNRAPQNFIAPRQFLPNSQPVQQVLLPAGFIVGQQ